VNLVLLQPADFEQAGSGDASRVRLLGRRCEHVRRIHRAEVGDDLCVGLLGGKVGTGRILALAPEQLDLSVSLVREPPKPLALTLVVALPRPLVLKRVLLHATTLGVKRIALIHSRRVEKSYWQSSAVSPESLTEPLLQGLEQARDTVLPRVSLHRRFRPFAEDELAGLLGDSRGFVAHPMARLECPRGVAGPVTLTIGPEGGFNSFEVERLTEAGLESVRLGDRALRVEAAIPYAVARIS
jgi:16S rRNA (uracil1498-N3)-methyltransferase